MVDRLLIDRLLLSVSILVSTNMRSQVTTSELLNLLEYCLSYLFIKKDGYNPLIISFGNNVVLYLLLFCIKYFEILNSKMFLVEFTEYIFMEINT